MPTSSKEELVRFQELQLLQKAGKIQRLVHQLAFKIVLNKIPVFTYTADFAYHENGKKIIEEWKGRIFERHDSMLRMKICSALYPDLVFRIVTKKGLVRTYEAGKVVLKTKKPRHKQHGGET